MYQSIDIARFFLKRARKEGVKLSNMKLQKMVFIANGFYLALTKEPLIHETVEAWNYGPVVSTVYHTFKRFGSADIDLTDAELGPDVDFNDNAKKTLETTWRICKDVSPIKLSNWTHNTDAPWTLANQRLSPYISTEDTINYFSRYLKKKNG